MYIQERIFVNQIFQLRKFTIHAFNHMPCFELLLNVILPKKLKLTIIQ